MSNAYLLAVALLICGAAAQATIYGTLYDGRYQPIAGVIAVNSTPAQQVVTSNGTYSLSLIPAAYLLTASSHNQSASKAISAQPNGSYRLDFVLVPAGGPADAAPALFPFDALLLAMALLLAAGAAVLSRQPPAKTNAGKVYSPPAQSSQPLPGPLLAARLEEQALSVPSRAPAVTQASDKAPKQANFPIELTEDEAKVMAAIDQDGGMVPQKQLRSKLPGRSSSKISLLVSSLQKKGLLTKAKQGRANLVIKN